MTKLKTKRIYLIISIFLVVYAGVFIASQFKTDQVAMPSSENEKNTKSGLSKDTNDYLGIMNFSKVIFVGLGEIVQNEGTSENVLELTESIETELNQTIADQTLDESQEEMVRRVRTFIESVETLANDDVPPEEILEVLTSRKSSK